MRWQPQEENVKDSDLFLDQTFHQTIIPVERLLNEW